MHKAVTIASDKKTIELMKNISAEIEDVLDKYNQDELKEKLEYLHHKQKQQMDKLEDFSEEIQEVENSIVKKLNKTLEILSQNSIDYFQVIEKEIKMQKVGIEALQHILTKVIENQAQISERIEQVENRQKTPWFKKLFKRN